MGPLGALFDPQFRKDIVQGLTDATNRGVVGGVLGGPVDLATMAMRPFGYSTEKPIMGSEWIGQKLQDGGFVSDKRNMIAETLAGIGLPMGALKAAPAVFKAEQAMLANAAIPRKLNPQAGVVFLGEKAQKMQAMDMERGWYRGADAPINGKRNGPMFTQDVNEAIGYAKGRDVREYAIPASGFLKADGSYSSRLPNDVAKILDDSYYGKTGKQLASQLRTYGPDEGITGGQLWQSLESRYGNDGAAEVLQKLTAPNGQPAFKGAKGMTRGDEAYVFKNAPVRDAEKAAFDPSKYGVDDIYGRATVPMLGVLGGTALGGSYFLRTPQPDQKP